MTALDELFEEMQSIWTADGKRKQLLIQRSQLEQALLTTHGDPSAQTGPDPPAGRELLVQLRGPAGFPTGVRE